jgi:hypothetical protein
MVIFNSYVKLPEGSKGASYLQLGCHHINSQQKHRHLSCSQDTGSHQGSRSNWQPTALLLAIVHHFRISGEAPGTWGLFWCVSNPKSRGPKSYAFCAPHHKKMDKPKPSGTSQLSHFLFAGCLWSRPEGHHLIIVMKHQKYTPFNFTKNWVESHAQSPCFVA